MAISHGNLAQLAVGYGRVSTVEQADRVSLDAQRHDIEAHAGRLGLTFLEYHQDAGISGKRDLKDRPGLHAAIQAVKAQGAVLVVHSVSRLARSQRVLWNLIDPSGFGIRIASVTEPFETVTPMGRAMLGMLAVWSALEADMCSSRTKAALAEVKRRGVRLGACSMIESRMYGKIIIDPEKVKLIRFVQSHYVPGVSHRDVLGYLNALGIKGPLKKKWHLRSVQVALSTRTEHIPGIPITVTLEDLHPDFRAPST
jgi:site-specific DNA recombinase